MARLDLVGKKSGYLTAIEPSGRYNASRAVLWTTVCECGTVVEMAAGEFNIGRRKSCGCMKSELLSKAGKRHGLSRSRIYRIWKAMVRRCHSPTCRGYTDYGGRGIRVCKRWRSSFVNFYTDMHGTYADHLSLDRIRVNRGYSKSNCRWADTHVQANNKRNNVYVETPLGRMTLAQASAVSGISAKTLAHRVDMKVPAQFLFVKTSRKNKFKSIAPGTGLLFT